MRRKDRETTKEFAQEIVDTCLYATLAMTDQEGNPYCIPISIVRSKNEIYFHCANEGKKLDCIKNNANVCISCVSFAENIQEKFTVRYKSAVVFGSALEITDKDEKIGALKLLCERHTPENMAQFNTYAEKGIMQTSVWKVEIKEITGKCNKA